MIVSAIDGFLDRYPEDETFDGDQVRTPLAGATRSPRIPGGSSLRQRGAERFACKTADGVETAKLPAADLQAKLCGSLRKAAAALREFRGKVEAVRRRPLKSDLQHAMNVLSDKTRRAVEACDDSDPDAAGASSASRASDRLLPLLRDVMTAQASVGVRMNTVKLTPAEKQPVKTLLDGLNSAFAADPTDRQALRAAASALKGGIGAEPFVPVRRRCEEALATIAELSRQAREAQDALAARDARWKMLQPTPRALGGLWSDFTAAERALGDIQARIESTRRHFQSDRPRPR